MGYHSWLLRFYFFAAVVILTIYGRAAPSKEQLHHIIIIYQENHSFDNLFGSMEKVDGIANAKHAFPQEDKQGIPYKTLPPIYDPVNKTIDKRFSQSLPNGPFLLNNFVTLNSPIPDPIHSFYRTQLQINDGKCNRFVAWSNTGGLPMGYYQSQSLPLYAYAKQYTILDHFFQAAFGGSFLNHIWLVAAKTPYWGDAPEELKSQLEFDNQGRWIGIKKEGPLTPDGYVVGTVQSVYQPHASTVKKSYLLPPLTMPTIGDRLSEAGISWAWYAGGWNDALQGKADPSFQFHHQPFVYFKNFGDSTEAKKKHLKDETDFFLDIKKGSLPQVCFVKPIGKYNEHPGYSTVEAGEKHAIELIEALKNSPYWNNLLIILTYDEFGGFWDHVPPPKKDRWGPGPRIPALLISPFCEGGKVNSEYYDTTSILKLIEWRFNLPPLSSRDKSARNLFEALIE
ncbi:acid phosphatase [Methylacidiphilum kamchatkense Kam1]|uniref:Acid phosphatase n=1 Tax=Methylacidiphilum kamchatkense Kam1 TaxID=1202785 RepID=A0ABR4ZX06_9BACT|nr:alkaline phosphatase family protein [Methylacidiphilum kamchatkense]KIE58770.1 acid phosphatase [Methylacidiphilum kamchatkense Kam1]